MDRQSIHQAAKEKNTGSAGAKGIVVFNYTSTEVLNERTGPVETKEV